MKKSFWELVGISQEIKTVKAKDLASAIQIAHASKEHGFYGSRWFIDIKNKFRVFTFDGVSYISKETSGSKADVEISNSKQAKERLNEIFIGKQRVNILVPKKITLQTNDDRVFLLSEYLGPNMNEMVYAGSSPVLSKEECLSFVNLLLEKGISYRGFLPRNIIEKDNIINVFDWEDASFSKPGQVAYFDHLWRTNFLLNWSYLYRENLERDLKDIVEKGSISIEPELVKYETVFQNITNLKFPKGQLRRIIDKVVFGSELPLSREYNAFYIRPNDTGHVIADIFPSEVDVLHDILSFVFRKLNELEYSYNLQLMTKLLAEYFKESLVQKKSPAKSLEYYAIIPILLMIEDYHTVDFYKNVLKAETVGESIKTISRLSEKESIVNLYLNGKKDNLEQSLILKIKSEITKACSEIKLEKNIDISNIVVYISQLSGRSEN